MKLPARETLIQKISEKEFELKPNEIEAIFENYSDILSIRSFEKILLKYPEVYDKYVVNDEFFINLLKSVIEDETPGIRGTHWVYVIYPKSFDILHFLISKNDSVSKKILKETFNNKIDNIVVVIDGFKLFKDKKAIELFKYIVDKSKNKSITAWILADDMINSKFFELIDEFIENGINIDAYRSSFYDKPVLNLSMNKYKPTYNSFIASSLKKYIDFDSIPENIKNFVLSLPSEKFDGVDRDIINTIKLKILL